MDVITAVLLGIIQGLTEFLPISSSGHLEIAKTILGDNSLPKESLLMTLVLHGATALSTIVVFRKDIQEIFQGLFQFERNDAFYFSLKIITSMIPAVFVGFFFEDFITELFHKNILLVGLMLWVTALLLYLANRAEVTEKDLNIKSALGIGIIQAIAILPGISRSGATIALGVILGIDKSKAARFSFLMVIPLIFGSMAKSILEIDNQVSEISILSLSLGFIAAFITGILACKWMIEWVKNSKLWYFSVYCLIAGSVAIIFELL
ncbi:MAG: undecaprenyl-diphosphate phosphatase [Flavobacteriaceae bacterium]|jgi:undecaprenyl-diphosphatase|nr:undecaprenyl-diphosphate phosphatase [Flavobacteriaceae bacterium]MDO7582351.1 undecaprenyl-diphosphate phosphatase [Flavobacteriaceae bacterium]MDO7592118.1 undecaprenyl-diphosphate phosphatase [Flavobacteriaceae bacterium]MDO7599983.1 undecaprenyl-diphosphate phosphatase [Flavobacteriaceae bacterium]MDO7602622.1 undecaprenyl-diphosphate phosphatase [Flavobacteriaceae bacterium]|tara:strand:- start:519 stop:1310 length:792 start_codon:yes stop_codon:yes gene_type:complete